ncbi:bifunctional non-homologous end joining protein LigD [Mucilaginibacter gossypiicola]|uniref:DNA ligase (ATP) n=1 Tax=Mucilaginibacter gossypiicola TaxID=551995 RepID=A0A1H8D9U6_9SPHI|nr:DNA ligase D [Mucilaginibacter gossypiicola]SEN03328.1 bifunctional non-homologous end joining protein LigD [Mucilaginibacter gossypiicola]
MAELEQYKAKRNFKRTAEPAGGKPGTDKLLFIVQKHQASHLHYDFRLEVKGVLKSWAVPRGPSMDPEERRLAMPVEDHPYDYKDFEGIIPKGQYGGGTVIVWDEGWYEPAVGEKLKDKAAKEHWMMSNYYKNALKITLHGHKLKGVFILIKFKEDKYEGGWRLIKADDQYATKHDILEQAKSVLSKLTIEQMAEKHGVEAWNSNRESKDGKIKKQKESGSSTEELKKQGTRKAMPKVIRPMLCTLTKEVIENTDYIYEVKWDGYRIISYIQDNHVRMDSRSALDYTKKYPPIANALRKLGHDAVLDGEVVVFNEEGKPDFDALQTFNGHDTPINYCVFDLLWLDGYNLMNLPLIDRKAMLKDLLVDNDLLRFSESFNDGVSLYQQALALDLEGIVAKRRDSRYLPDARDNNWLKTPTRKRQEFVIGGWAESDKSRSFRSLLFGAYNSKGELEWIGRSGGGYKEKDMPGILAKLQKLEIDKTPFINKVLDSKGANIHWVRPELVANFEFATWTKTGRIRKPATFLGFRKDKKARQVIREVPLSDAQEEAIINEPEVIQPEQKRNETTEGSNWVKVERKKINSERDFEFAGHNVTMNNIEQELWRGITKARLITYYHSICNYILPHLKDRPLSLHIKQDGAMAPGFYIKDMEGRQPDYLDIFSDQRRHKKKGKNARIDYAICNNEAALLYLINLGNIDLNPWSSTISNPQQPDFINIDLDPSDEDFGKAIKSARAAKEIFDGHKLQSLVKTSGKTGIHLLLPCESLSYAQARNLAEKLCAEIAKRVPEIATTEVNVSHRGDKLFVDPSQNDYADTLACVYSVRPYKHPTVSTPLDWKEVRDQLNPGKFTMDTLPERLEKKGDLFAELHESKWRKHNTKILKELL